MQPARRGPGAESLSFFKPRAAGLFCCCSHPPSGGASSGRKQPAIHSLSHVALPHGGRYIAFNHGGGCAPPPAPRLRAQRAVGNVSVPRVTENRTFWRGFVLQDPIPASQCDPQCHTSRSVVSSAILITTVVARMPWRRQVAAVPQDGGAHGRVLSEAAEPGPSPRPPSAPERASTVVSACSHAPPL